LQKFFSLQKIPDVLYIGIKVIKTVFFGKISQKSVSETPVVKRLKLYCWKRNKNKQFNNLVLVVSHNQWRLLRAGKKKMILEKDHQSFISLCRRQWH